MNRICLILCSVFTHSLVFAQITFSEIMFDVATDENHDEFIELFNLSSSDSVDLTGWQFSDSAGTDQIIAYRNGTKIPPRSFAVILDGSYITNSTSYDTVIPDSVVVLTIDNNAFGSNGLSNTKGELLSLMDNQGNILTRYRYSTGNKPGFSDEKMILDGENTADNWQNSQQAGGTPGFRNSVSPRAVDLGLDQGSLRIPDILFEGDSIKVEIEIYNLGTETVNDSVTLYFFIDQNENNYRDSADQQITDTLFYYSAGSPYMQIKWNNLPAGRQRIGVEIVYSRDENYGNDSVFFDLIVLIRQDAIHINEIKFLARAGESEWIELTHTGNNPVSLRGWCLSDGQDTVCIDSSVYLYPEQLKVVSSKLLPVVCDAPDTLVILLDKFLTLNNSEDDLILLEPGGRWMERLHYEVDWLEDQENEQVSLERINPLLPENNSENWGPSVAAAGATPAAVNSIYAPMKKGRQNVTVSPNPFSPDQDGYQDAAIISGEIPGNSARMRVQIFDLKGRLIRTLKENHFSGRYFNIVWDGKDNSGHLARIGIYIIFIQVLNEKSGVIREMKSTVVLAHEL
jgi:archaellum component FlaF (FlaF/FlaG flagellin family)